MPSKIINKKVLRQKLDHGNFHRCFQCAKKECHRKAIQLYNTQLQSKAQFFVNGQSPYIFCQTGISIQDNSGQQGVNVLILMILATYFGHPFTVSVKHRIFVLCTELTGWREATIYTHIKNLCL